MGGTVARGSRVGGEFESSRPWVIGAMLLCGVGTLGSVVASGVVTAEAMAVVDSQTSNPQSARRP